MVAMGLREQTALLALLGAARAELAGAQAILRVDALVAHPSPYRDLLNLLVEADRHVEKVVAAVKALAVVPP